MINRVLIFICIFAFLLIIVLNITPLIWTNTKETFIRQDLVENIAISQSDRLYTLNFDQQKKAVDILNRAIPVGDVTLEHDDTPLTFASSSSPLSSS